MGYLWKSFQKFKDDVLSKSIYDVLKWLTISFIILIPSKWIPVVGDFLNKEFQFTIFWLLIFCILLIIITTLIVSSYFKRRISAVLKNNFTDELTGLKNHKALNEYLSQKIQEYRVKSQLFSIIILDIDDFKACNTKVGFNVADEILRKVGQLLGNDKRATDETFRFFNRGDEFLVVASETNLSQAIQAAERKRELIQKNLFSVDGKNYHLTVCCGVTEFKKNDDFESLTDRVIDALNEAKKITGKNNSKSIL